jgi:hypothetical protein
MSLVKDNELGGTYSMYKEKTNSRNSLVSDLNLKGTDMLPDVVWMEGRQCSG